ncbi:hypothetical protein FISHEDRAFT_55876 [Fistulina hepatica ATCC 64428]|uniref:Zn(2)-C6 fungal-type domain-containing protein n=1 Tax=Fistulina hepatica ATCC 64428 TaxID=1128425 RepID=A0A0D7AKV9_9AGAR|nr:hypothetical protein FISHEDRAFT_55876 [Fistulina hepatica ATCC 64428]
MEEDRHIYLGKEMCLAAIAGGQRDGQSVAMDIRTQLRPSRQYRLIGGIEGMITGCDEDLPLRLRVWREAEYVLANAKKLSRCDVVLNVSEEKKRDLDNGSDETTCDVIAIQNKADMISISNLVLSTLIISFSLFFSDYPVPPVPFHPPTPIRAPSLQPSIQPSRRWPETTNAPFVTLPLPAHNMSPATCVPILAIGPTRSLPQFGFSGENTHLYSSFIFARSDLLSRHVNKCHPGEAPPTSSPSTGSGGRRRTHASLARATTSKQGGLPCDGSNPCMKCAQKKIRCTFVKFHRQTAPSGPGHGTHPHLAQPSSSSSVYTSTPLSIGSGAGPSYPGIPASLESTMMGSSAALPSSITGSNALAGSSIADLPASLVSSGGFSVPTQHGGAMSVPIAQQFGDLTPHQLGELQAMSSASGTGTGLDALRSVDGAVLTSQAGPQLHGYDGRLDGRIGTDEMAMGLLLQTQHHVPSQQRLQQHQNSPPQQHRAAPGNMSLEELFSDAYPAGATAGRGPTDNSMTAPLPHDMSRSSPAFCGSASSGSAGSSSHASPMVGSNATQAVSSVMMAMSPVVGVDGNPVIGTSMHASPIDGRSMHDSPVVGASIHAGPIAGSHAQGSPMPQAQQNTFEYGPVAHNMNGSPLQLNGPWQYRPPSTGTGHDYMSSKRYYHDDFRPSTGGSLRRASFSEWEASVRAAHQESHDLMHPRGPDFGQFRHDPLKRSDVPAADHAGNMRDAEDMYGVRRGGDVHESINLTVIYSSVNHFNGLVYLDQVLRPESEQEGDPSSDPSFDSASPTQSDSLSDTDGSRPGTSSAQGHVSSDHGHGGHEISAPRLEGKGFSSAFGLMSLDDPDVLAGLKADGTPFFSKVMTAVPQQFQAAHVPQKNGDFANDLTPMPRAGAAYVNGVFEGELNASFGQPLYASGEMDNGFAESSNHVAYPLRSSQREAETKELRDFWKTYIRTPFSTASNDRTPLGGTLAFLPTDAVAATHASPQQNGFANSSAGRTRPQSGVVPQQQQNVVAPSLSRCQQQDSAFQQQQSVILHQQNVAPHQQQYPPPPGAPPGYKRGRVGSLPSVKTPTTDGMRRLLPGRETKAHQADRGQQAQGRTVYEADDLRSYEAAVLARKVPAELHLDLAAKKQMARKQSLESRAGGAGKMMRGLGLTPSASTHLSQETPGANAVSATNGQPRVVPQSFHTSGVHSVPHSTQGSPHFPTSPVYADPQATTAFSNSSPAYSSSSPTSGLAATLLSASPGPQPQAAGNNHNNAPMLFAPAGQETASTTQALPVSQQQASLGVLRPSFKRLASQTLVSDTQKKRNLDDGDDEGGGNDTAGAAVAVSAMPEPQVVA